MSQQNEFQPPVEATGPAGEPVIENLPPVEEPPVEDLGTAPMSTDAQRGQQGPASEQTGAEQTGVDDTGREGPGTGDADVIGVGSGRTAEEIPDPQTWTTGDEPMTESQRSFLESLARQAGETLPADLTKAEASEHIDRLQQETGRGTQG